jgi:hypothetical protein
MWAVRCSLAATSRPRRHPSGIRPALHGRYDIQVRLEDALPHLYVP